jgi:photosystem II stability/assembly factor-like uncharacterized protein
MRKCTLSISCFLIFFSAFVAKAQQVNPPHQEAAPNFYDMKAAFVQHFMLEDQQESRAEEDGAYSKYKRWEWYWEQRVSSKGVFPAPGVNWQEYAQYVKSHSRLMAGTASTSGAWSFVGPTTTPGGYEGIGRISCIAFHPTLPNTFWVGTPAGGLWKTTDGGSTWSTNTDNLPVLGVSDVVIDPADPMTMYMATGDGDMGSLSALTGSYWGDTKSVGVLKSTDGGATWNTTGLSFTPQATRLIRRLIISPSNSKVLVAACSNGVYRTNDAGLTWTNTQAGHFIDLAFKPGDASVVYGSTYDYAGNAQVFTSTDTALTFVQSSAFNGVGRIKLGVTAAAPSIVHALCSNSSTRGFAGLYVSRNSGASFSVLYPSSGTNLLANTYDGSGTGGQGEYDLAYSISPVDTNVLFVGGVNTWKSLDAGATWVINTMWTTSSSQNPTGVITVHADKHFIGYHPLNNGILFQTNDGGIYKSTDAGTTWTDLSNGLGISEIYRIGTSASNPALNMAGLQDNGSRKFDSGTWSYATGGDGCECIIDYVNPMNMYGSYVQGKIYATTDAWTSTSLTISDNIPGIPTGSWITPYVMDPVSPATLYAGYADVYKTTDQGATWAAISSGLTGSSTNTLMSLSVAPSNSQVIYAATWDSVYVTSNGGTSWTSISNFSLGNKKTYIAIHPTDPNTAWITISGYAAGEKVYKTTDRGVSWTNISGTLPNLPVNTIVYQKGSNGGLYIGTDVGVYYTDASMTDWIPFSTGLPNVVVTELEIQYSSNELRAGTFGRGLWKSDLYTALSTSLHPGTMLAASERAYPNPNKGQCAIYLANFKGSDKAHIYNYLGETLRVLDVRTPVLNLDLSEFPDGIYYVGFESSHYNQMQKIVKLN